MNEDHKKVLAEHGKKKNFKVVFKYARENNLPAGQAISEARQQVKP